MIRPRSKSAICSRSAKCYLAVSALQAQLLEKKVLTLEAAEKGR
jgi:hypothetical protein